MSAFNITNVSSDWSVDISKNDYVYPLIPNGCTWYRQILPSLELSKYGWKYNTGIVGFKPEFGFAALSHNNDNNPIFLGSGIVVFKLIMHKLVVPCIPQAKDLGQTIVVDVDDWFKEIPVENMAHERTDPLIYPLNNRNIYEEIILAADAVVCSTQFLFDHYSSVRDNVHMVRNGIDLRRWTKREVRDTRKPTIGWVGMTPWRGNDLETMRFMNDFLVKNDLMFNHVGWAEHHNKPIEVMMGLDKSRVISSPSAPIYNLPGIYNNFDIGIVPLCDHRFNYAKSYLKGLEYAAAGIPFVASWSPEYQVLADAGIGRIARTQEEWEYHLEELMDPQLRADEADINYEILKRDFTMHSRGKEWNKVYRKILK